MRLQGKSARRRGEEAIDIIDVHTDDQKVSELELTKNISQVQPVCLLIISGNTFTDICIGPMLIQYDQKLLISMEKYALFSDWLSGMFPLVDIHCITEFQKSLLNICIHSPPPIFVP